MGLRKVGLIGEDKVGFVFLFVVVFVCLIQVLGGGLLDWSEGRSVRIWEGIPGIHRMMNQLVLGVSGW